ncbi:hypothetical protein D6855_05785 [Butyrivibrio sp. CB08]|uniref:sensor histidine kinase n=1 Tax=Butyrivibrio sp. CB08 TaxID=2364879 RepID=UPI000EA850B2|nr:histidine kinase [Butyrivibrio sp. CB08]RKM61402.1 hypothetical protein D6855_05785 [Butyrivibrio sp. CB08]
MVIKYIYTDLEFFGALFCWVAAAYLIISRSVIKRQYRALASLEAAIGVMLFFDALAWLYRGNPGRTAFVVLTVVNFLNFVANAVLPVFYSVYILLSMRGEKSGSKFVYVITGFSLLSLAFISISQFNGYIYRINPETNLYERGEGFNILTVLFILGMLVGIMFITKYRKNIPRFRRIALLSFIILPLIAAVIQAFIYGYSLSNIACIISGFIMFAQALDDNAKTIIENEIYIKKQSEELTEMRTKMALSQMKPEFLYDTLNSIYSLCDKDVSRAKEVIVHLSNYLRQDIESIDADRLVSFAKELNHTMVYLELEKTRCPGRFEVEYHTNATGFELPALTIQPLVENALRHGIYKLPPGDTGKIMIYSAKGNGYVKISVVDNGVGFDMTKIEKETGFDRNLAGIQNVRNRLKIMEDAELHIQSQEGFGTIVDIIIPTKG